jgi:hypothetical protein
MAFPLWFSSPVCWDGAADFLAVLSNAAAEGKRQRGMAGAESAGFAIHGRSGRAAARTRKVDYAELRKTSSNFRIGARGAPSGMTAVS